MALNKLRIILRCAAIILLIYIFLTQGKNSFNFTNIAYFIVTITSLIVLIDIIKKDGNHESD
ncbi:MAG: hypothetical protein RSG52_05355 [Terrisporobacter sp.]|uniref:hypothetical protein n=1 Tax=Terrisporobacter sp. TaxID=1965305 RepID=UPI002FCC27F6